uniref:RRM domain-containing protein n=1 Tax=Salix viminalis TaxID=40686 RepID=A0A6N2KWM1_SALVM
MENLHDHEEDEHEHEHEVYGGEIPDEGEMDADIDMSSRAEEDEYQDPNSKDLEDMKKRLKEIEEEASALREMQAKVEKEMGAVQDSPGASATQAEKEEVDSRSIYVGNVDYSCTPEEVQQHFQSCGTVNRVTILTDKFGQPKGFAYVEFVEADAIQNALLLNESELHGRQLKVSAKRTNVPGMKLFRGRRPSAYGFRSRRPFMPYPAYEGFQGSGDLCDTGHTSEQMPRSFPYYHIDDQKRNTRNCSTSGKLELSLQLRKCDHTWEIAIDQSLVCDLAELQSIE